MTPYPLSAKACSDINARSPSLEECLPEIFKRLKKLAKLLEAHYREAQEIEFIIQENRLWVLQTRGAALSRFAVIRVAVEMVQEGLITVAEALKRTEGVSLNDPYWILDPEAKATAVPIARGLPASNGVASGVVALTADRAEQFAREEKRVIFVSDYVEPEDIHGIDAADGLVTNRGGVASHLAVTARGWNRVCVVGCGTLAINIDGRILLADGLELKEGNEVTVDGNSGLVYRGLLARQRGDAGLEDYISAIRNWRSECNSL
jgi:pyruvate,orthophosphate dikinase